MAGGGTEKTKIYELSKNNAFKILNYIFSFLNIEVEMIARM